MNLLSLLLGAMTSQSSLGSISDKTGLTDKQIRQLIMIAIPLLMYGAVITTMLCKAVVLGVTLIRTCAVYAVPAAIAAICGAALFVASDFSIAILIFNKKYKKSYPLKMFNMATYFLAVLLLSSLILFVKA